MLDNRKALSCGMELDFNSEHKYRIIEEIGRGSSCIVYSAKRLEGVDLEHKVRIKECYPYNMDIQRTNNHVLKVTKSFETDFENAKDNFYNAYKRNVNLKNLSEVANYTEDALNLFQLNNTWYSVVSYTQGNDYRVEEDNSLSAVFKTVHTLGECIKKYHDKGILHLDIKPENMLVIPETKELIKLFDFDSMLTIEELKSNAKIKISFSDGFAAPELVRGNRKKICEATDIYSIGAMVFYKIFGRTPVVQDCLLGAEYDFSKMKYANAAYPRELYKKLTIFLQKTLSVSVAYRYKAMSEVLPILEELQELSDLDRIFLCDNFTYNSPNFVGRREEICEIKELFETNQVVFLSGIGGIGKTEIAKRFAWENMDEYRTVVFVSFLGSIAKTVCGDDLQINGFSRVEGEIDEDYFYNKLSVLKKIISDKDLIILDNFDIDASDEVYEELSQLLNCKCKFLITTREDFRGFNFAQIDITEMKNMEELLQLFHSYNSLDYADDEAGYINEIIELVGRHTMAVELVAKYLYTMDDLPSELFNKMEGKEGITNTEKVVIQYRKDEKISMKSINNHLLKLFDLSVFSDEECELIKSLSLLGYVRISKRKFLEYCNTDNNYEALDKLIRQGWIQCDTVTNKISLHQIILDLVYNHLKPVSEDCPHIVRSMTTYANEELGNDAAEDVRSRVLEFFAQRLSGADENYVRFLIAYCENIKGDMDYLECAKEICKKINNNECKQMLSEIYMLIIKEKAEEACYYYKDEGDMEDDMIPLAMQIYEQYQKCNPQEVVLSKICVEIAYNLDQAVKNMDSNGLSGESESLNAILEQALSFLERAEEHLRHADMSGKEKIEILRKIRKFYSREDFITNPYRCKHFFDSDKVVYYRNYINKVKEKEEKRRKLSGSDAEDSEKESFDEKLFVFLNSYSEYGNKAFEEGEYEKAIRFYKESINCDEVFYENAVVGMSRAYVKLGQKKEAMECLRKELKRQSCLYKDCRICDELITLLLAENNVDEANQLIDRVIEQSRKKLEKKSEPYYLESIIKALIHKYELGKNSRDKEEIWKECEKYFQQYVESYGAANVLCKFVELNLDRLEHVGEKIRFALRMGRLYSNVWTGSNCALHLFEYVVQLCENSLEYRKDYILALLECSNVLIRENTYKKVWDYGQTATDISCEKALGYCQRAEELYEQNHINDEYLLNRIYKELGECYSNLGYAYDQVIEMKKRCDYYFLAQEDAKDLKPKDQITIWKNAAEYLMRCHNYEVAEQCYQELFAILNPLLNQPGGYSEFPYYWSWFGSRVRNLLYLKKWNLVYTYVMEACEKLSEYYSNPDIEKHNKNPEDLGKKLRELAGYLYAAEYIPEAINLYSLSVIQVLDYNPDKDFFMKELSDAEEHLDTVYTEFTRVIHGKVTDSMIDWVIDTWERFCKCIGDDKRFERFAADFEWFQKTYKHQNIEFTR